MPYVLKPNKLFVKDPEGAGFLPQNVVTDRTTADAVTEIQQASTEEQAAIEAKGAQTRASVPDDYTTLSDSVSGLKSAFNSDLISIHPTWVQGKFIEPGTGNVGASSSYYATEYIGVKPNSMMVFYSALVPTAGLAFYDGNKFFVSGYTDSDLYKQRTLKIPANAYFVRYCCRADYHDSSTRQEQIGTIYFLNQVDAVRESIPDMSSYDIDLKKKIDSVVNWASVAPTGIGGLVDIANNVRTGSGYAASFSVSEGELYRISGRQFSSYPTDSTVSFASAFLLRSSGNIVKIGWIAEAGYFSDLKILIPSGIDELVVNLSSSAGLSGAIKKAVILEPGAINTAINKANQNETNISALNTTVSGIRTDLTATQAGLSEAQKDIDSVENTVNYNTLSPVYGSSPASPTGSDGILQADNTVLSGTGYKASKTVSPGDVYVVNGRQFNSTNAPAYILRSSGSIVECGWIEPGYFSNYVVGIPAGVDELVVNLNSSAGVANAIRTAQQFTTQDIKLALDTTESTQNIANIADVEIGKNWTGATAADKAVLYIPIVSGQTYYLFLPASTKITNATIIQKDIKTGQPLGNTSSVAQNTGVAVTTVQGAKLFCIQFNGTSNIVSSDFANYPIIVKIGNNANALTAIDYVAREQLNDSFDTMFDLIQAQKTGVNRVGGIMVRNLVTNPKPLQHTQEAWGNTPYYDANSSVDQYEVINNQNIVTDEYILNNLQQEEIDFTPSNDGFTRIIMGKSRDDVFFVSYVASSRKGQFGYAEHDAVEITTDFVNFRTIIKGNGESGDGVEATGKTFLKAQVIKQFADGTFLVPLRCHDIATDADGIWFYKLSADYSTLTQCQYTDFDGNTQVMRDPFNGQVYDWHVDIKANKGIVTTYGSRNPETDLGRVWYTEDNGNTWKLVFQMTNHYQDGVDAGTTIPQTHLHGVMLDPYTGRMYVIAGENNRNIFWSDKGIETTDNDWNVIPIRNQTFYHIRGYSQVVGGYAFKDALVFGSDNAGLGSIDRLNKLDGSVYSKLEPAHEFLPNAFNGTSYCMGEQYRRDLQTPLLFCMTRENAGETEAKNEELNNKHRGRVVASYDGVKWTEVWRDDTYGSHDVNIDNTNTTRNYSYCTRGMNCYLLKNGDAVIKYSGRDFYYFGGVPLYSVTGYSNGSCKVRYIHGAEKYLK